MTRRVKIIILLLSAAIVLAVVDLYVTFFVPASRAGGKKIVNIQKGMSFRVVATDLEEKGVIRSAQSFIFASSILGDYKKVRAGEYELDSSMTPLQILDTLVKGKVKKYIVTIPEGYNIREVAEILAGQGLSDEGRFLSKVSDGNYARTLGFSGPTLEGYLFPDTYEFTKGMTDEEMIARMVGRFLTVYDSEFAGDAKKRGMTMLKAVTLASIIEKETGSPQERELISAVFHNRLKKGVKLQSDPTVIYDIMDFNGALTRKNLRTRSPHNTYFHYGLPPGPISNPGRASLRAAINPAKGDYLYFVSKNDGTHFFSRSLKEHNRAVSLYQRHIRSGSGKGQQS
jgi:peptidoglycan lytic transglycosylase G